MVKVFKTQNGWLIIKDHSGPYLDKPELFESYVATNLRDLAATINGLLS